MLPLRASVTPAFRRRARFLVIASLGLVGALCLTFVDRAGRAAEDPAGWQKVKAPDVWKNPPKGKQGYGWYRCLVTIPANWKGRDFELFVEPVDDAREYYLGGQKVGVAGAFPPEFRSGLGGADRFRVDPSAVRVGEPLLFAIRVFDSDGRGGFNVAAPVLFGGNEAIRLEGTWQFRAGDNPDWAKLTETPTTPDEFTFAKVQPTAEVNKILRRLSGEEGPLPPEEALRRFKLPEGLEVELAVGEPHVLQPLSIKFDHRGRMWVVQYLQYPNPAGLTMLSRDKFLRSVYDKTPLPPPNHFRGADKITIHEDTDGDGKYDKHSVFVDGLSLVSSFAFDRDGVWVLNPPYLLFYPDKNHDDVPDGDPIVHLEGFGIEDSHSIANNLRWGPDGWLYAGQGSTVTGSIRKYRSKDKPVHSMGQLIWRYQPQQQRYEVFAEGGGNTFGVEFDAKGRVYSGHNGGDTRGFHYVQGGYYQKGFGKHGSLSNPFAFGYFPHMSHPSVPRFTHAFVIYEGGALGSAYEGHLYGVAPLQSHVVYSRIEPLGSTFKTTDLGQALSTNDTWCRPVDIQAGPDGAIYVADMYEQRIDHASHYQGRIDRTSGRVYRIQAKGARHTIPSDLSQRTSAELLDALGSPNKWTRQTAQRLIAERHDPSMLKMLEERLAAAQGQSALEYLWAIRACGGFSEAVALKSLGHDDPYVRLWSVRLVGDDRQAPPRFVEAMKELAYREPNVEVRSQLACSARRLPASQGLPVVAKLLTRSEDLTDPHLPLLLWWAIESSSESDRDAVLAMFQDTNLWEQPLVKQHILERTMRRFAQAGGQKDLHACGRLLELAPSDEQVKLLMAGFEKAFEGRALTGLPDSLVQIMAKRGGGSLALRLRQGEANAIAESLALIADEKTKKSDRLQYLQILGQVHPANTVSTILKIVDTAQDDEIRIAAISALQGYESEEVGTRVMLAYSKFSPDVREVAHSLLASRSSWSSSLLKAVDSKMIAPDALPLAIVRRMQLHRDDKVAESVRKYWGDAQASNADEIRAQMEKVTSSVAAGTGNPYKGHAIFKTSCGKCHRLFDDGGSIGPDLTAFKRDDFPNMLINIVNPSLQIREGFESFLVFTNDGRTLNGFVADQDNRVVVLRTPDGQTLVVSRDEIDEMRASPQSIMPEGVLKELTEQQIRDLFAYLRSTQPLPQ